MITIEGLNKRQRAIADVIWMMNGHDAVMSFIKSLEPATQKDALTVLDMMVAAVYDEIDTIDPEVSRVIDAIAKR